MPRIFNVIRKKMLSSGRFTKYLLYAIGEVVLVVIGILIALQINNHNEQRKVQAKEQTYLSALKEEFEYNKKQLEKVMTRNAKIGEVAEEMVKHTGPNEPNISEEEFVKSLIDMVASEVQYRPSNGVLQEIISSGKLGVFHDPELRNLLSSWDGLLYTVQFQEREQNTARMEVIELFNEHGNVKRSFHIIGNDQFELTASRFAVENRDMLKFFVFENRIMGLLATSRFTNAYYYPKVEKSIDQILELIEGSLDQ